MNKYVLIIAVIIFLIIAGLAFVYLNKDQKGPSFENEQSFQPNNILATPTLDIQTKRPDISGLWIFDGMTGVKNLENGYEYEWGKFVNSSQDILWARCSAPNSPTPDAGEEYVLDTYSNILVPVVDNEEGTKQRFWYPTLK